MIYISRYLQQLRYPVTQNSKPVISRQPFNSKKDLNSLYLTDSKNLVPLAPTNNGILPSPISSINANRIITFPDLDQNWFANGFPDTITPKQEFIYSSPVDVVPVNYIANSDDNYTITGLGKHSFWLKDGSIYGHEMKSYAKKGEIIATAMYSLKEYEEYFADSKIISKGYWKLLGDFGIVNPRIEVDRPLSITSGVTEDQCKSLSYSIGYANGLNGKIVGVRDLTKSLSQSLTDIFNVNMLLYKSQNINTTIRFDAQKNIQRIGIYQFIRSFQISPSQRAYNSLINKFNKPESFKDITFELSVPKSIYQTEHFQKVYVIKP